MTVAMSSNVKHRINEIFLDSQEKFSYSHFTEYFKKSPISLTDFLSIPKNPINVMPKSIDDWNKIIEIIKKYESNAGIESLQTYKEDTNDRIEKILSYLACKNSFLFFNVGSFHHKVFNTDKRIVSVLKERLKEKYFRFIVSSSNYIMKKNGHNAFLETLLNHQHKGVVINVGQRMPLHFISIAYTSLCGPRVLISFEDEHDETQVIRKRYTPYSDESLNLLYASQLKQILKNGFIVKSTSDFEDYDDKYQRGIDS